MEFIQLLPEYSLPWERVYRVVAQKLVYMSEYIHFVEEVQSFLMLRKVVL
jgi:hypothetical protein